MAHETAPSQNPDLHETMMGTRIQRASLDESMHKKVMAKIRGTTGQKLRTGTSIWVFTGEGMDSAVSAVSAAASMAAQLAPDNFGGFEVGHVAMDIGNDQIAPGMFVATAAKESQAYVDFRQAHLVAATNQLLTNLQSDIQLPLPPAPQQ